MIMKINKIFLILFLFFICFISLRSNDNNCQERSNLSRHPRVFVFSRQQMRAIGRGIEDSRITFNEERIRQEIIVRDLLSRILDTSVVNTDH